LRKPAADREQRRPWQDIDVDLAKHAHREIALRLYQSVLILLVVKREVPTGATGS
jgi:hypothetical protein